MNKYITEQIIHILQSINKQPFLFGEYLKTVRWHFELLPICHSNLVSYTVPTYQTFSQYS